MKLVLFSLLAVTTSFVAIDSKANDHADHKDNSSDSVRVEEKSSESVLINNEAEEIGFVKVHNASEGILIEIKAEGLTPGKHGMHFHEVGSCQDHQHFKTAKGHIMPYKKPHGFLNEKGPHGGNLPNLIVHEDGTAHVELYSNLLRYDGDKKGILDSDGSALIIHTNEDDHLTQPIGGSGARVACAKFEAEE